MKHLLMTAAVAAALAVPGLSAAQDLPPAVSALGLTDVQVHGKRHADYGRKIHGTLPGGTRVEIELDRNGEIEEVEARGRGLFPIAEIRSLIPEAVQSNSSFPADARVEKIEFEHNGRIEIDGRLANGREFDAEFTADGQLIEFDVDD
ncbi:PepSY-like domain-containing protein [Rhizobiaceae bacterium BDR2-2]|uniref:PepSY-like domain-containing protein n=1 Tax=Ectorhizobium quercum TaxID=2965071 RepID=A0AAE3MWD1_9HYPH|nr:hypothetical protein [Ectorhizobium quercum]MCX8995547.1 PepSY-like domain-containing protein [Ectorhizobium quercum]